MSLRSETARYDNKWYKLDNAAKIYPAISGASKGSVFRVAVQLKCDVNPLILQEALAATLPRFPTLAVKIKKGLFWYYFEPNPEIPEVTIEKAPPCRAVETDETKDFLFRVCYYKKRISLEVFHALTDGTGALAFLKLLISQYLTLSGFGLFSDSSILDCEVHPSVGEIEDSFEKYYNPRNKSKRTSEKAYHIIGTRMPSEELGIVHGIIPLKGVLGLAKENKATLTEYITALIIYSIYSTQLKSRVCHLPVKISVPVNLRNFFPSQTLRNFSSYVNVGLSFTGKDYTFDEILGIVSDKIKSGVQPDKIIEEISSNVKAEKNILMRLAPLVLKNVVLKTAFNAFGENLFTCSLSNLGAVRIPDAMEEYIDRFEFVLGPPIMNLINCSFCSFRDDMIMTFTKVMHETDIERFFFRFLSEKGLKITIETN
jgi:hypothetical protein